MSPLARCLGLVALGLHFLLQDTLTLLLGLGLVDLQRCVSEEYIVDLQVTTTHVLDQRSLVLEGVTLAQMV